MKTIVLAAFVAAFLAGAGCVSTVNERSTAGVPFLKDKIEASYPRPVDTVFQAAKEVVLDKGTLINEGTVFMNQTNAIKTVEGRVNERKIWIRVEPVDSKVTKVTVQARTKAGGADVDLAAQLDKEIALKLAQ
jgi:hypothetical protein